MIIVFFCILIVLIIISVKIGISFEINKKDNVKTILYIKILKDLKIYSKPLILKKMKAKIKQKDFKNIDNIHFIKEILKKIIIKKFRLIIELNNDNIILNTYITAIIASLIETLRLIKKTDNIEYKITTREKSKLILDLKLEIYIIEILRSIIKCIDFQKKEIIYNNK